MTHQDHTPTLPTYLRPELLDDALESIALWDTETELLLRGQSPISANDDDNVGVQKHKEAA